MMPEYFQSPFAFAAFFLVAAASGLVGAFALMRKMTLASDAISHIALPGLGIAILLKIHPLFGGAAALLVGAFLVWLIEQRTKIATETVIGVLFSASLAAGSLLTPEGELLETLFGDVSRVSVSAAIVGIVVALAVIAVILFLKDKLTLALISSDLSRTLGLPVERLNLVFLLTFVVTVLLGLQFLGVLLMGSLVIVPAAVAKNLARSLSADLWFSAAIAVCSVILGMAAASRFDASPGPYIISVAAAFFFLSMLVKKRE